MAKPYEMSTRTDAVIHFDSSAKCIAARTLPTRKAKIRPPLKKTLAGIYACRHHGVAGNKRPQKMPPGRKARGAIQPPAPAYPLYDQHRVEDAWWVPMPTRYLVDGGVFCFIFLYGLISSRTAIKEAVQRTLAGTGCFWPFPDSPEVMSPCEFIIENDHPRRHCRFAIPITPGKIFILPELERAPIPETEIMMLKTYVLLWLLLA